MLGMLGMAPQVDLRKTTECVDGGGLRDEWSDGHMKCLSVKYLVFVR